MFKFTAPVRLIVDKQSCILSRGIKSDLKIKWVRPEKVSCVDPEKSGDRSPFPVIDTTQCALAYRNSKELET